MSRIGKKPISIPDKAQVVLNNDQITVKGPLGELSFAIHSDLDVVVDDKQVIITRRNDLPLSRSFHGLTNRIITNMLVGTTVGFTKELEVIGVGYKVAMKGKDLEMYLGFSHPVLFTPPAGITIKVDKMNITISGIDKQLVGETAAKIRKFKSPEPYKGKGIKYVGEQIRRKSGKMTAGA
ncbi:MAG TPA: 50S ribosomal protein L6 [bacterium]|nr:50S ribosomal protein L6 [bacterium]